MGQSYVGRWKCKIAYCTDTVYCDGACPAQDADVLIHKRLFHQDSKLAFERLHSTSTMAAQVAAQPRQSG